MLVRVAVLALLAVAGCGETDGGRASEPAPSATPTVTAEPYEPTAPPADISAEDLSRHLVQALGEVGTLRVVLTQEAVDGGGRLIVTTTTEVDVSEAPETSRAVVVCNGALCEPSGYPTEEIETSRTVGDDRYYFWDGEWLLEERLIHDSRYDRRVLADNTITFTRRT